MWNRSEERRPARGRSVPGVIDTIGLAFTRLAARPWVVLGPVLLDLYLWLGLRITAGPLLAELARAVRPIDEVGAGLADTLEREAGFNLAELLSLQLVTVRVPTLIPLLVSAETARLSGWNPGIDAGTWWLGLFIGLVFAAAGFIGGAVYFNAVRDVALERELRFEPGDALRVGWRLFLWLAATAGLMLLVSWPVLVAQAGFVITGGGISAFLASLLVFPAGLGFVFFFFSAYAIVLHGATATEAFRASYRVVPAFGVHSLGFIASYMIVTGGVPVIGGLLMDQPPGTMIAIIGNAFVSTGMIAAGMIYYDDRAAVLATHAAPQLRPETARL